MAKTPSPPDSSGTPSIGRIAGTSFVGTAIEWYDFFIYANAAALVFGKQFFPSLSPLAASLASLSTFAVGFLARPLGSVLMGHFGDRAGRKSMLVTSLLVMGVATVLIGVLPTYAQIGVWAPVLLVALRFAQGLGVGGEWGGAVLVAVEHAPGARRGFYGSFPQMGVPAGIILSNLVFLTTNSVLGPERFAAWGWRVPFLLSAVLIAVGLYIRLRLEESPLFLATDKARMPVVELLRGHWRRVVLAGLAFMAANTIGYITLVYVLSYTTGPLKMARSTVLLMVLLASVVQLVATPALSALSDRLGRRKVFVAGAVLSTLWAWPLFLLLDTRSPAGVLVGVLVAVTFLSAMYGPQAAIAAELFPTRVRYSGASLGYQLSAIVGGGLAPLIATSLYAATGTSLSTAAYLAVICLISLVAIVFVPETHRADLDDPTSRTMPPQEVAQP
ncbi:MFS transporter [Saccharothrix variisporea]|uniref:Putative proline/betaine transporter n=1 Tax=Saccharothrix variisporea TaxID=543527 RepID=A0A495XRK9_9PSEU|nr:MFS transporter [Saccharothrix variisporea]RKT75103.1 metabolite-proton symporter [Saccharothrix variisporea]